MAASGPEGRGGSNRAPLENVNVADVAPLRSPAALHADLPLTPTAARAVRDARAAVAAVVAGRDPRFLVVVGPCSIHDLAAAREYLERLGALSAELGDRLLVLMRVYFEKPRTTTGWKGLINDPRLDDSFAVEEGLSLARGFLLELAEQGMPAATEALDPVVPQYLGDLVAWYAIGARTTESQTHREMASGLSAPCRVAGRVLKRGGRLLADMGKARRELLASHERINEAVARLESTLPEGYQAD